jgi:hypothetical protein
MIIILTDEDLGESGIPLADISFGSFDENVLPSLSWAEDVYFWRDGEVKVLKRRNAPLTVPDWLRGLQISDCVPASDYEV